MTSEQARRIAQEVADGIFGAGASETQRLGALAVSTITKLADLLDASGIKGSSIKIDLTPTFGEPPPVAEAAKPRHKPAQAHDRKAAKT